MNSSEQFERLKNEHLKNQYNVSLNSIEQTLEYLTQFTPIEDFLKSRYLAGETNDDLWNFNYYYHEQNRFEQQFRYADISVARHFRYDRHYLHRHDFFQMNYVCRGDGNVFIGSEKINMRPGDFLLIAPETEHYISIFSDDCILIKYYIRKSTFEKTFFEWLSENNLLSDFFRRALHEGRPDGYIMFHADSDVYINNLALLLYAEMMNHRDYYKIVGESRLTELFCLLVREHSDMVKIGSDANDLKIASIIKYMQREYRTATLELTAKESGYSRNYLCRILSSSTGHTFTEILNEIKIEAASKLLLSDESNIRDISRQAGFNTPEHFFRTFKRIKGMTPHEWQESHNK